MSYNENFALLLTAEYGDEKTTIVCSFVSKSKFKFDTNESLDLDNLRITDQKLIINAEQLKRENGEAPLGINKNLLTLLLIAGFVILLFVSIAIIKKICGKKEKGKE